jgi:hypothetical protein
MKERKKKNVTAVPVVLGRAVVGTLGTEVVGVAVVMVVVVVVVGSVFEM